MQGSVPSKRATSKRAIAVIVIVIIVLAGIVVYYRQYTAAPPAKPAIYIGVLTSLTGPFAPWGTKYLKGAQWAVQQIDAQGGVLNANVSLIVQDDKNDPAGSVTSFDNMVQVNHAVAVMGTVSSDLGLAESKEAEKLHVPLMLHEAGSDAIFTRQSQYTFRTCLPGATALATALGDLVKTRGFTRVAAINADYEWGHAMASGLQKYIGQLPNVTLKMVNAPVRTADFTPYLRDFASMNPQILIATGHPPGSALIVKQGAQLGLAPLVGPLAENPAEAVYNTLGDTVFKGIIDFTCINPNSPEYQQLATQYYNKFHDFFDHSAANGYFTIMTLTQAIKNANSADPTAVANAIRTGTYTNPALAWPYSYTQYGTLSKVTMPIVHWESGPPPGGVDPGAAWHLSVLYTTSQLPPYIPP